MRKHIDEYLVYLELERGLSATTRASYAQDLALLARFLKGRGVTSPAGVQAAHVREFLQSLRGRRSPTTIAR